MTDATETVRVLVVVPIADADALLATPLGNAAPCAHIRSKPGSPATHTAYFGTVPTETAAALVQSARAHPLHQTMQGVAVAVWGGPTWRITMAAGFSLNTPGRPWNDTEALAGLGLRRVTPVGAATDSASASGPTVPIAAATAAATTPAPASPPPAVPIEPPPAVPITPPIAPPAAEPAAVQAIEGGSSGDADGTPPPSGPPPVAAEPDPAPDPAAVVAQVLPSAPPSPAPVAPPPPPPPAKAGWQSLLKKKG